MSEDLAPEPKALREYVQSTNPTVEAILKLKYPMLYLAEATLAFTKKSNPTFSMAPLAEAQAGREKLLALSAADLQQLHAKYLAREEASLFFNTPRANADFGHWAKLEYWTLEESVALLLGKDPDQVTQKKLKGYAYRAAFPRTYEKLLKIAQRAQSMSHEERLKPADVLTWAQQSGAVAVPEELARVVGARETQATVTQAPAGKVSPAQGSSVRWTEERLAELRSYKTVHGTKAAAEKFQISGSRVRELVPTEPKKPIGYSAFSSRPK